MREIALRRYSPRLRSWQLSAMSMLRIIMRGNREGRIKKWIECNMNKSELVVNDLLDFIN